MRTGSSQALFRAARWSFVMDTGSQGASLVITFVLAGLLGPRTFGLAAMALVYTALIDLLQRQGMVAAIVQRSELTAAHRDTSFWLVVGASGVMTAASVAGAGWWADVNRLPELAPVIVALSPTVLLKGLSTVQQALLRREMAFRSLALRTLSSVVAGGVVGIVAALAGWGVYALVAQQVTASLVAVVVLWTVADWRPRFRFSSRAARELLGFSAGAMLSSLAVFVNNRADALLLGLLFGPTVVGTYRLAARLLDALVGALVGPVQALALPELAPHRTTAIQRPGRTVRLMRMAALGAVPALGVLLATAGPLTALLGPDWSGAAAVIRVLCVVALVRVITAVDGPLLQAVGSPYVQAALAWTIAAVSAAVVVGAAALAADLQPAGQALAVATGRALVWGGIVLAIHLILLSRWAGLGVLAGLRPLVGPVAAGVTAAVLGSVVGLVAAGAGWGPPAVVLVTGASGTLAAGAVLIRVEGDALRVLQSTRRRRAARASGAGRLRSVDAGAEGSSQPVGHVVGGEER